MPQSTRFIALWALYPLTTILLLLSAAGRCYGQAPLSATAVATSACYGSSTTIIVTASGGTPAYYYSLDGGAVQNSNSFVNVAPASHTIQVTDFAGDPPVTLTITPGCIQSIIVGATSASCGKNNGDLQITTVVGGVKPYQYSIDGGATFQTGNDFSNIPGKMYSVWVKDANNTVFIESIIVGGIAGPSAMASSLPATCAGNDGSVSVSATGLALPLTYELDAGGYGSATSWTGVKAGPHTVYVQDGNGCITPAPTTVDLNNTLVLTTSGDATICEGKSVKLKVSSNESGTGYSWSPATKLSSTSIASPTASPTTTTTYTVTGTWEACTQSSSLTVTVNPAPAAITGGPDTTCYGKSVTLQGSGQVRIATTSGGGANSIVGYEWRPGTFLSDQVSADPVVVQPTATTIYHLQVTDANQCTSLNTAADTVTVTPPPQLFAGDDTSVVTGEPVPLHALDVSHSGFISYQWTPPDGLSNAASADPIVLGAQQTTTYLVTGTTAGGCLGLDSVVVKVYTAEDIYVPNAFTPNHDGHNDVLRVTAPGLRVVSFGVWDRWGSPVFTTTNPGVFWDGTKNGKEMPAGVYVWMAVGVDFRGKTVEKKGTVMVIR